MSSAAFGQRRVLVVGQRLTAVVEQALAGAVVDVAGVDAFDGAARLPAPADLVVIDATAGDPAKLAHLIGALAQSAPQPAAILVGSHLPVHVARAVLKLRASDVLEHPTTSADLARCAAALLADGAAVMETAPQAQCWSVISAVGGAGATTLTIELATTLAARSLGDRVALIDLNLADGAASAYLGAVANMHLADASVAPERIDQALLDAFSLRVGGGFDLFACPRDPHGFAKTAPTAVLRLLEVACQAYDWIMVDMPRNRQPWTMDLLAGSNEILVVSELTVPALLAARALSGEIEGELPDRAHPRVILNRMASRMFGPAPSRAEAEKALGRRVDGVITSDWEAAACSANLGGPISQHRPRSKIVKDVSVIVEGLLGAGGPTRKAA
ncbi:MAG TPA: AAA family ATPase [Caulobacteraceae bacterium]|nr:AAA family ATPase [Caulobacteraceae bacterium]